MGTFDLIEENYSFHETDFIEIMLRLTLAPPTELLLPERSVCGAKTKTYAMQDYRKVKKIYKRSSH